MDNNPVWKVTFGANYQSTTKHYHIYIHAQEIKEAIKNACNWYSEHYTEGEEIKEPYIIKIKLVTGFVADSYVN